MTDQTLKNQKGNILLRHPHKKGGGRVGGVGWVLEIFHVFADSTLFKQYVTDDESGVGI